MIHNCSALAWRWDFISSLESERYIIIARTKADLAPNKRSVSIKFLYSEFRSQVIDENLEITVAGLDLQFKSDLIWVPDPDQGITLSQSEAIIQVTWSLSTNERLWSGDHFPPLS